MSPSFIPRILQSVSSDKRYTLHSLSGDMTTGRWNDHTLWLKEGEISSSPFQSLHGKGLDQLYGVPYVLDNPTGLREFRTVLPFLSRLSNKDDEEVHALTVSCYDRRTKPDPEKDFYGDYRISRGRRITLNDGDSKTRRDENTLIQLICKRRGVADDADGAWRVLTLAADTQSSVKRTVDKEIGKETSKSSGAVDDTTAREYQNEQTRSTNPISDEVTVGVWLKQLRRPYIENSLYSHSQLPLKAYTMTFSKFGIRTPPVSVTELFAACSLDAATRGVGPVIVTNNGTTNASRKEGVSTHTINFFASGAVYEGEASPGKSTSAGNAREF